MSSDSRVELLGQFFEAVRQEQEITQAFDEAAARHLGIHLTDLRVLDILDRMGPVPASTVARAAHLTTGSTTTLLDRLERAGYATRRRDDKDRRRVFVELTDHARQRTEPIWGPLAEEAVSLLDHYSEDELKLILGYLRRSQAFLRAHRERVEKL
ncbi:MarR family transcriptional regulator [Natronospirillum operosum]|uniref:MarR family transcriptional regulator n=1 Tax=Natronospirillum operosum TaxID=2759953 RepID=A0A4Z0WJC4_9GAMM|nr:MarR family winged helix-turn-helix transcriptional regulator [Natronospirillum operosum]TGG95613.1 MarR family transcriptional regulator [Natronospirillum operosum]